MAFGDCSDDAALRAAWKEFCQRLEAAGDRVFKDYNPAMPLNRADGFRFMTQNLGQVFDLAYESKDTRYPVIHAFCSPFCKLAGDCADFVYQQAWLDGQSVYRISGNRGTAPFLNFTLNGAHQYKQPGTGWPTMHEPFGSVPQANLRGDELQSDWDGSFELFIGGPKRGPNWLPTAPDTSKVFIRQGFDKWSEEPAIMRIERVDMDTPRPLPTPQSMITAIDWAGRFMSGLMNDWPDWPYLYTNSRFLDHINQFPPEPADAAIVDKRRGRAIANMSWILKSDEAMIIEFDSPQALWNITNMGPFFVSMDFLYRQVGYTKDRTKIDSDGRVRLVMCHDDPGYHNWVDTQGFERGNVTFRLLMSEEHTPLSTRVVKRARLADELPLDSVKVTREERLHQLHERFDGVRKRYRL